MTMNPKARAPRPKVFELYAQAFADPKVTAKMDPLKALTFASFGRAALNVYEHECVDAARKAGATWQEIGDTLGIPRQNAQRKYGDPSRKPSWHGSNKPPNE